MPVTAEISRNEMSQGCGRVRFAMFFLPNAWFLGWPLRRLDSEAV